jgi:RNA polymerase sigma-70 factor (ECF subfamily)
VNHGSVHTPQLHDWIDRYRAGDRAAADALLRAIGARLEHLAQRMLKSYPNVNRWADSDDVLQNATLRLLRTLENVRPESVRSFLNLAAVHIRRELLDLARHFGGPLGVGANHASTPPAADSPPPAYEPADPADDPIDVDRWRRFHEAVERLPAEEREVVGLKFYHGWQEAQIAELFQVTDRTVRRWWRSAGRRLTEQLGGAVPDM